MEKKSRHIAVSVTEEKYRTFKAKIAQMGKTVGGWVEEQIEQFINEQKE